MITLYHGSNVDIKQIDLTLSKPDKDFGQGFYLTDIKEQALDMAKRRCRILGVGEPIINSYKFGESLLDNGILKVRRFEYPSVEWAKFIVRNRQAVRDNFHHDYDVVIGPIADDGVAFQLSRYEKGWINIETLAEELKYKKLNRQYYFGTERAIKYLKKL